MEKRGNKTKRKGPACPNQQNVSRDNPLTSDSKTTRQHSTGELEDSMGPMRLRPGLPGRQRTEAGQI